MSQETLTYKTAGVDIDKANELVEHIKPLAKATHNSNVLNGIGGFGALYAIPKHFKEPVLVSGTDGVGTKLRLAIALHKHDTIGIDLVAMCVNDIITLGATPLFFLDYYAMGQLNLETSKAILNGIAAGCEQANCALIGGETAEMPGMYHGDDYDLSGFCVGAVDKSKIIDGQQVKAGDQLIALGSSGPHSNGYSLIRKVLEHAGASLDQAFGDSTLGDTLLTPTIIYSQVIQTILQTHTIKAMSHITGGGIPENLPRVLPHGLGAVINTHSWQVPEIFQWLQQGGNIPKADLWRTFNMGVGMILVVNADETDAILSIAKQHVTNAWVIGAITNTGQIEIK